VPKKSKVLSNKESDTIL